MKPQPVTASMLSEEALAFLAMSPLQTELTHTTPLCTNTKGGVQSNLPRNYTLVPADALAQVARVLHNGLEKYGKDNWKLIDVTDHLNHALSHIYLHLEGNPHEDHLAHATTRLMMALDLYTKYGEHA